MWRVQEQWTSSDHNAISFEISCHRQPGHKPEGKNIQPSKDEGELDTTLNENMPKKMRRFLIQKARWKEFDIQLQRLRDEQQQNLPLCTREQVENAAVLLNEGGSESWF